jgi:hypothetical protein
MKRLDLWIVALGLFFFGFVCGQLHIQFKKMPRDTKQDFKLETLKKIIDKAGLWPTGPEWEDLREAWGGDPNR